jgi:hypothetical protein
MGYWLPGTLLSKNQLKAKAEQIKHQQNNGKADSEAGSHCTCRLHDTQ